MNSETGTLRRCRDAAQAASTATAAARARSRSTHVVLAAIALHLTTALLASAHADTLGIAVAANLQSTFPALQAAFEKQSGHRLQPSVNASGRLVSQITLGAPFDVFMSADMGYPEALRRAGASASAPVVYANGVLVLWSAFPLDLTHWQRTLAGQQVRRIAVPNPATAPYGREAMRIIAANALQDILRPKLVFAESVSQANQYIHSKAVDAGFTAKSVVTSTPMRGVGTWIELPAASHAPIAQGVVITRYGASHHPQAARQFVEFLLSAPAREIFASNGYRTP